MTNQFLQCTECREYFIAEPDYQKPEKQSKDKMHTFVPVIAHCCNCDEIIEDYVQK